MIEIMKLHFRNKQYELVSIILILLSIILIGVTIQLISWNIGMHQTNTIKILMFYVGPWLGVLGGLFVLTRGKNGEGKFLSRLPIPQYEVFMGKVIFLLIGYVAITTALFSAIWLIVSAVKLLYPSLQLSGIPTLHAIGHDAMNFVKIAPPFLFLAALGLWLQKWFSSDNSRNLLILGILVIFVVIPTAMAFLSPNHSFVLTNSTIVAFIDRFHVLFLVGLELALFFGAMGLYRLRHFRNF